jgi:NADPH:quinone reductase-like Zn-dependent oxidoreductase
MRTWTLVSHGDPRKAFALRQMPDPEPKPDQVLVKVEGFGLNFADVMAGKGLYRDAPPLPSVLGYEVVGRVERCGTNAPKELIGKRVVGMTRFGGYAEKAVTDHRAIAEVGDEVPLGEAASLATQGCTAWYAARILCPLMPGQRVLVHSAAGGVGQILVQLALDAGCEVFAVANGVEKMAYLKELGVQHVVDRGRQHYAKSLRQALGGRRLSVSFNAVGGSSYRHDMALLGHGGRIVLYGGAERGSLGTLGTLRFVWRMGLLVPILLMMKSQSVLGLNMLRISEHEPELLAICQHAVAAAYRKGIVKPKVHKEYAAEDLPQAHLDLAGGGTMGKLVVRW